MSDNETDKVTEISDTSPAFENAPNASDSEAGPRMTANEGTDDDRVVKVCEPCMVSLKDSDVEKCPECGGDLSPIRAVQDDYVGTVVNEKYKIVEHLGSGGMAEVYLGLNEPLGQRVAIKFLNEKFTNDEQIILRFLNEARSYCKVNHPNAVTLHEYGQHDDGALYIITEYVEGTSLTEVIDDRDGVSDSTVISIALQCCEVLSTAHEQGVIHRDLKPDNIMLMEGASNRFNVKILDFGIAKIIDDERGPMTETGSVFGTPEFMSPEQARGESGNPASDIYAIGIVMFYMVTGKLPFEGESQLNVLNKQLEDSPPSPTRMSERPCHPELEEIILKCLEKSPADRFESAETLYESLAAIDLDSGTTYPAASPTEEDEGTPSMVVRWIRQLRRGCLWLLVVEVGSVGGIFLVSWLLSESGAI